MPVRLQSQTYSPTVPDELTAPERGVGVGMGRDTVNALVSLITC